MQTITTGPEFSSTGDNALLAQIAALRQSLQKQRVHAVKLWDAWSPEAQRQASARRSLGKYTESLIRRKEDADHG